MLAATGIGCVGGASVGPKAGPRELLSASAILQCLLAVTTPGMGSSMAALDIVVYVAAALNLGLVLVMWLRKEDKAPVLLKWTFPGAVPLLLARDVMAALPIRSGDVFFLAILAGLAIVPAAAQTLLLWRTPCAGPPSGEAVPGENE